LLGGARRAAAADPRNRDLRRRAGRSARHDDAGAARRVPHAVSATHLADHLAGLAARDHRGSASASRRLFEVLDTSPSIVDPPQPAARPRKATVRLHNVRFRYPDASEDVLQGVNLEIRNGETMALVGATGSGKTTLTELVPRLYDVTGGEITIGGVDVRDLALDDLRALVAVAFEEATLFSASVHENLTLGRPGVTDEDVAEAIDIAQAGFVYDLPYGLETRIGEQGLSPPRAPH